MVNTDFYADGAALKIPEMFEKFDDESAHMFVSVIKNNETIKSRIRKRAKLNRLRNLGEIVNKCERRTRNLLNANTGSPTVWGLLPFSATALFFLIFYIISLRRCTKP